MGSKSNPKVLLAAFLSVEAVLYAVFLTLDLTGHSGATIWLKYAGILLCLLAAARYYVQGGDALVLPALILTAMADALLLVLDQYYLLGVALFICVQTTYLLRLRRVGAGPVIWLRIALPLLLGCLLFYLKMATPLNLLVSLYFSQLLVNTILAWSARKWLFAAGLTLFVGCDVCVGLFNLGLLPQFAPVGMWLFYLPSQVLIALSAKEVFRREA